MDYNSTAKQLFLSYEKFFDNKITHRQFKHCQYIAMIEKHLNGNFFNTKIIGKSFEGREIYTLRCGKTKNKKVLIWSQMHGNEPTATLALADIFNFLSSSNDSTQEIRNTILNNLNICFVPMLNPDGAERFDRRNAQGIDLNRDATKLVAPESNLLMNLWNEVKPQVALNLHDQELYYTAGAGGCQTAMAFLSPAYNTSREENNVRHTAMHLIGQTANSLHQFIPGRIGRYSDEYSPNSFGDTFTRLGTSSILIESGAMADDNERTLTRKLNFVAILNILLCYAEHKGETNTNYYYQIPLNVKDNAYDLKITNLTVKSQQGNYTIDIGIRRHKINIEDFTDYYTNYRIENIGDLTGFSGIKNYDAQGCIFDGNYNELYITRAADFNIINQKGQKISVFNLI